MAVKESFTVERDGPLMVVTLDRPNVLNALDMDAHVALARLWDDYYGDPDLRAAIITGAGQKAFCAGADIKASTSELDSVFPTGGFGGLTTRLDYPKPIIAAVNGLAFGGGFEITLSCDIVVAEEHARFALPEPLIGVAALAGGIAKLCRKLPHNQAMAYILTGDAMSAADARHYGLVQEVVPQGEALQAAKRWAERIMRCAPMAIQVSKQIADRALRGANLHDLERADREAEKKLLVRSGDFQEGREAFLQKRSPRWSGR